ncbi:cytochrome c peroxidase [uncultured Winogradskyella sp.]|uniref:cytochrome-c peroxidase n=1 Tax=uncultured Winogradskyella sp. TaxID=395353 RepID=UPI00261D4393|nr:cytochrome c peroxidase [uncultured Winogradskyella sp.]
MKNVFIVLSCVLIVGCASDNSGMADAEDRNIIDDGSGTVINLSDYFDIDFNSLDNYENQSIPNYIDEDNTPNGNQITNEGATLGRILFYDNTLSVNNTVSCASCHKQAFAFGDIDDVSIGANGVTARHSMRLINARFGDETNFFWDERANSLEQQTTMPIRDHAEMGFSGENDDPNFNDLISRLETVDYYPELFNRAFGSETINETRIQNALSQFIRSIQSFDSRYDDNRILVNNDNQPFPNFTNQENLGKQLFTQQPNFNNQGVRIDGGFGCAGCHGGSEFSIAENRGNNGVIGVFGSNDIDLTITRSPTLRDIVGPNGQSNGAFFHDASANSLEEVLLHYNTIATNNPDLDNRLRQGNNPQQLEMTTEEMEAIIAFLETLTGEDVYTNEKWSDPFIGVE